MSGSNAIMGPLAPGGRPFEGPELGARLLELADRIDRARALLPRNPDGVALVVRERLRPLADDPSLPYESQARATARDGVALLENAIYAARSNAYRADYHGAALEAFTARARARA